MSIEKVIVLIVKELGFIISSIFLGILAGVIFTILYAIFSTCIDWACINGLYYLLWVFGITVVTSFIGYNYLNYTGQLNVIGLRIIVTYNLLAFLGTVFGGILLVLLAIIF